MFTSPCLNKWRDRWHAEFEVVKTEKGCRAVGKVFSPHWPGKYTPESQWPVKVTRDHFDVAVKADMTFQVDIGTGSGVKVKFRVPLP